MRFRRKLTSAACVAAAAVMIMARPLRADNVILTLEGCTAGCTTSPFAMVSLQQNIDGISVDLTVTLDSDADGPYHFHKAPDSNHFALAFHIVGDPSVSINIATAGFSLADTVPGSFNASPFGTFEYALKCTGCGNGYAGGLTGPLQLTVTPTSGTLTPSSFKPAGAAHFFSVDIVDFGNNSGNVADPGDPAPEPATEILLGSALVLLGAMARRRRPRPAGQRNQPALLNWSYSKAGSFEPVSLFSHPDCGDGGPGQSGGTRPA